ncbi:MAG: PP2C family protein-serine/threonine phosphatase [bacterium]
MARVVVFDPGDNDLEFLTRALDAELFNVQLVRGGGDFVREIADCDPECVILYLDGQSALAERIRSITGDSSLREVPLLAIHGPQSALQPVEAVCSGALQILHTPLERDLLNANVGSMIRYRQQLQGMLQRPGGTAEHANGNGEELRKGQEVLHSMLPPRGLSTEHFELASRLIPGGRLCGDYQDYRLLDGQRLAILQADVSGNGFVTAMVASRIKAWFDDNIELTAEPDRFLAGLNRSLLNFGDHYQIATAVCAMIDLGEGRVHIANAGHRTTYWLNLDGRDLLELPSSGPALGMFERYEIDREDLPLQWKRNRLVLFTDGLVEFKQDGRRWMSEDFFRDEVLRTRPELPIAEYCDMLLERSLELTGDGAWRDDVSLIGVDF